MLVCTEVPIKLIHMRPSQVASHRFFHNRSPQSAPNIWPSYSTQKLIFSISRQLATVEAHDIRVRASESGTDPGVGDWGELLADLTLDGVSDTLLIDVLLYLWFRGSVAASRMEWMSCRTTIPEAISLSTLLSFHFFFRGFFFSDRFSLLLSLTEGTSSWGSRHLPSLPDGKEVLLPALKPKIWSVGRKCFSKGGEELSWRYRQLYSNGCSMPLMSMSGNVTLKVPFTSSAAIAAKATNTEMVRWPPINPPFPGSLPAVIHWTWGYLGRHCSQAHSLATSSEYNNNI